MNTPIPALALLALLVAACSSAPAADDDPTPAPEQASGEEASADVAQRDYHLTFRDRTIDLYPYVQGFPYAGLMPDLEFGHMLYFETTPDAEVLRILDIEPDEPIDLTEGRQLGDVDWSTRSFRYGEYNPLIERFVFLGDESNDEEFNLFTLDLDSGDIDALTDVDYIYGFGFSPDHQTLGYIARHGDSEPFNSCLTLLDLEEHSEEQIWCDEGGADRLTWSYVDFAPDGDSLIVRMQHDGDRSTTNIGRFHADAPGEPELLLERGVEHLSLWWLEDSYDGDELIYVSSHTGINNLYRHRLEDDPDDSKALTDLSHDITSAAIVGDDDPALMLIQYLPTGSILELLDPTDGTALYRRESDDNLSLRDHHGATSLLTMASVHTPFRMQVADLHRDGDDVDLHTSHFASLPEELADQLIQCDVTQVDFPTFDEVDGTPRMLHGYYYEPLEPPEDAQRLVQLTAFYGGGNQFRTDHQIMCEAGIATFSPAPRGSRGFGAEFAALNDGDLGGDDIIDLFYAARWLEANHHYRPWQIGVHGASHGGYAAMRALTFPPETNDRDDHYDFGFGLSHAGISDLMHFYRTSNIPDWLVLLVGDPDTEADRLRQRSPIHHIDRLQAPLLLTHGSQDSRVPLDESQRMYDAATEASKPVYLEIFEGQGHGIRGLDNRLRYYRAIFQFLEDQVDPRLADR